MFRVKGGMRRRGAARAALAVGITAALVVVAAAAARYGWWLLVVVVGPAVLLALVVDRRSDVVALRDMHAYPVGEAQQPVLCRIVREMTARARVPMPRVYVSPTLAATALATGRDPRHAAICVTQGALELLDHDELRAVVGHELAHIRRRDTRPASVVGSACRVVVSLPVLGPILNDLARVMVDPAREFAADQESARLTGTPLALSGALRKLDGAARDLALPDEPGVRAAGHLMITNPADAGRAGPFRTHPPLAERVFRLEQLAGYRR